MAHTRIYPMDSQRYDMAKRTTPITTQRRAESIYFYAMPRTRTCPINSQRYDPSIPRRVVNSSSFLIPDTLVVSEFGKPVRHHSRMDSQRYDPSLRRKPSYITMATNATLGYRSAEATGNLLTQPPVPMVRGRDGAFLLTPSKGSSHSTLDAIFESRSIIETSSASSVGQSGMPTPSRRGSDTCSGNKENETGANLRAVIPSHCIIKTAPPCGSLLCGLDCRSSTTTMFDIVLPAESNVIPYVIRHS